MKALQLTQYGADARFEENEVQKPRITDGYVIVEIKAVSVNTVDTMIKTMGADLPLSPDLPAILGMDFSGVVTEVGEGVSTFNIGDAVYGCAGGLADLDGALADYILADARLIAKKPISLSWREAAALPLVGITAYEGLKRAGVNQDQKVLVHGGTGGVGHVALQLAQYFGAEVFATAAGKEKLAIIEGYGAAPIDYKQSSVADYVAQHTSDAGFDLVFDSVGGANMVNSFAAAKLNGQVASTVSLVDIDLSEAHFKGLSLHVVFMLIPMLHNTGREIHGAILAELATIVDAGHLRPLLDDRRFDFTRASEAYEHLASGQAIGKVVIER